jgi:hypothetical protein
VKVDQKRRYKLNAAAAWSYYPVHTLEAKRNRLRVEALRIGRWFSKVEPVKLCSNCPVLIAFAYLASKLFE